MQQAHYLFRVYSEAIGAEGKWSIVYNTKWVRSGWEEAIYKVGKL